MKSLPHSHVSGRTLWLPAWILKSPRSREKLPRKEKEGEKNAPSDSEQRSAQEAASHGMRGRRNTRQIFGPWCCEDRHWLSRKSGKRRNRYCSDCSSCIQTSQARIALVASWRQR